MAAVQDHVDSSSWPFTGIDGSTAQRHLTPTTRARTTTSRRRRKSQCNKTTTTTIATRTLCGLPVYRYDRGNCPNAGSTGLPFVPYRIWPICCSRYRPKGRLSHCLLACAPSVCCTHSSSYYQKQQQQCLYLLVSATRRENCPPPYTQCNTIWWKLHDTVGPAPTFRLQQQQQQQQAAAAANNHDDFWDIAMIQDVHCFLNKFPFITLMT